MTNALSRRLDRLETTMGATGTFDLAAMIEAGRRRVGTLTEAELQQESEDRLGEMRRRHTVKPLRGLERRIMEDLTRVCAEPPPQPHSAPDHIELRVES